MPNGLSLLGMSNDPTAFSSLETGKRKASMSQSTRCHPRAECHPQSFPSDPPKAQNPGLIKRHPLPVYSRKDPSTNLRSWPLLLLLRILAWPGGGGDVLF